MSDDFVPDETDLAIIDFLRRDGRSTNQQIADQLGLTGSTVALRIRRMERANKLRVIAVSDFTAHGIRMLIPCAIEVSGRPVRDVAEDLLRLSEVFALHLVNGPHDLDALLALEKQSDLALLLERLARISGIRSMDPAIAVDVLKYKFDVAPIGEGVAR